jgi:hypothetical protein
MFLLFLRITNRNEQKSNYTVPISCIGLCSVIFFSVNFNLAITYFSYMCSFVWTWIMFSEIVNLTTGNQSAFERS